MSQHIEKTVNETNQRLAKTGVLLALALCFQIGLMPFAQPAVGPLVNMTLLIAAIVVGPGRAVMIGCLTPFMAFMLGIMPLAVLVPVVMLGNTVLIIVFHYAFIKMSKRYQLIPVMTGALAKFFVMATTIRLMAYLFMPGLPAKLIQAFSLPQLYTAMLGGIMALLILRYLPEPLQSH